MGSFVFLVYISFSSFVIYKNSPCTPSLHFSLFQNSALRIPNSSLSLPLSLLLAAFFLIMTTLYLGWYEMAYEVTATRRRPQCFEDLAGQEFVAETLKNSIKTGRIAHAYLFSGPRGCGKTSSARILAKALNCQSSDSPAVQPCGQCESCKAITNSASIDVIEIDGASNTSVNDVRQIKDEVMFPPNNGRYKIYIIDEVHMLSTSAFNALLKTIEEPPPYVIFIFATTELQKVPATIKSRCQQYNFRLVGAEKLKSLLSDAAAELGIQADDEALYWVARESGGSVRDSYTLFDQVAAFSGGHITYEKIRDKLGLLGVERLNSIFESCVNSNAERAVQHIEEFLESGISIEQLISNSAEYLRSLLLIKNGVRKESLLGQSYERFSATVIAAWNTVQAERALSVFLQLYRDIRYSISPRYELELAFSRLCWLTQYVSPPEVKASLDAAYNLLAGNAPARTAASQGGGGIAGGKTTGNAERQNGSANNAELTVSAAAQTEYNGAAEQTALPQKHVIPAGMPQFSALTGGAASGVSSAENSAPETAHTAGQAVHSQHDERSAVPASGARSAAEMNGAASPLNSVGEQSSLRTMEAPSVSASPVLSVPSTSASTPSVRSNVSASSMQDWSDAYAPDDDAPDSDDDYSSVEEDSETEAAECAAPADVDAAYALPENPEDVHESSVVFTAPDGASITMGKLFGAVVAELTVNNASLAAALMRTGRWELSGNTITTVIDAEYQKSFIEREKSKILSIIEGFCHAPMQFEVVLAKKAESDKPEELPLQVKILCNAFKGSPVGV